jgi:hypothetical protein
MERYLSILKRYVRNKARLEAYMASNYMYDETLKFLHIILCIVFSQVLSHVGH